MKGALLVCGVAVGWFLVQLAWRRAFPEKCGPDGDALANRNHCHDCDQQSGCANANESED